jgi:hypothetical protein
MAILLCERHHEPQRRLAGRFLHNPPPPRLRRARGRPLTFALVQGLSTSKNCNVQSEKVSSKCNKLRRVFDFSRKLEWLQACTLVSHGSAEPSIVRAHSRFRYWRFAAVCRRVPRHRKRLANAASGEFGEVELSRCTKGTIASRIPGKTGICSGGSR